jgi:hypothetical protein
VGLESSKSTFSIPKKGSARVRIITKLVSVGNKLNCMKALYFSLLIRHRIIKMIKPKSPAILITIQSPSNVN